MKRILKGIPSAKTQESACLWSNRTRTGGQAMFPGRKRFETVQQCGRRGAYSLPDSTGEQERRDDCLRHCDENIDSSWSARVNRGMWVLGAGNRPRLVSSIVAEFDSEMWQPLVSVAILQTVRLAHRCSEHPILWVQAGSSEGGTFKKHNRWSLSLFPSCSTSSPAPMVPAKSGPRANHTFCRCFLFWSVIHAGDMDSPDNGSLDPDGRYSSRTFHLTDDA